MSAQVGDLRHLALRFEHVVASCSEFDRPWGLPTL